MGKGEGKGKAPKAFTLNISYRQNLAILTYLVSIIFGEGGVGTVRGTGRERGMGKAPKAFTLKISYRQNLAILTYLVLRQTIVSFNNVITFAPSPSPNVRIKNFLRFF